MITKIWDRMKKLGTLLILVLLLLFGALSYGTCKLVNYTITLHSKLITHEENEKRIALIQETLQEGYGLSSDNANVCANIFDSVSRSYKIPWQSFAAVARIESNYNPIAKSNKDARGIMQVQWETAKLIAEKLGIQNLSPDVLYKPEGIRIGCIIFAQYVRANLHKGDTTQAIKEALRCYVGGTNHSSLNDSAQIYVKEYTTTTSQEYDRFVLISKGVLYDSIELQLRQEKSKNICTLVFERIFTKKT